MEKENFTKDRRKLLAYLDYLASPAAERESDYSRITLFCKTIYALNVLELEDEIRREERASIAKEIDDFWKACHGVVLNHNDLRELLISLTKPEWPKRGDYFYRLNSSGEIIHSAWSGSDKQRKIKEFGNCFRSRKDAEAAREKIKGAFNLVST